MKLQREIWDEIYKKGTRWNKQTKSLPEIMKGKKVLELGVGNGKTLISILKQKPKSVVAIDFSREALKECEKEFSKSASASFIEADVTKMPFEDGSFDVIVCYYIMNNLDEKKMTKAANEIERVLKKKGVVLFEDFAVGDFRGEGRVKKIDEQNFVSNDGIKYHYFTIEELKKLFSDMKEIKFEIIESRPLRNKPEIVRKIIRGKIIK
jgi:ubiquinone/menaquinone biosynthesis C-methylase UbiE